MDLSPLKSPIFLCPLPMKTATTTLCMEALLSAVDFRMGRMQRSSIPINSTYLCPPPTQLATTAMLHPVLAEVEMQVVTDTSISRSQTCPP